MSVASASAALSALQLDKHPMVSQALASAAALAGERRYRAAEAQLRAFLADTQAAIQQTKTAAAPTDAASPLPSLSQLMTGVLPYLRTLAALQREAATGEYDLRVMLAEVEQYKRATAAHSTAAAADATATPAPPSRPPHADFVHPRVHVAPIAGSNRGLIASSASVPAGAVAAVAASSGPPPICIPAHTTVLSCKAVALVRDDGLSSNGAAAAAVANADGAVAAAAVSREERLASALVTLLTLRMQSQPSLIAQLYQLDAGERYEDDRARRLARRSPLDAFRLEARDAVAGSAAEAVAAAEADHPAADDLEIDLERLALIVARNAFSPPQDSALQQDAAAEPSASSSGVWFAASFVNHSCHPNSHWFCVGDQLFVRTLRPLHEGEEVTISYTGYDAKLYSQRQALCRGWSFECRCRWCDAYVSHPQLVSIEETFVKETGSLEPRVHELIGLLQSNEEGTLTYKRALTELTTLKNNLERAVESFKQRISQVCGPQCTGRAIVSGDATAAAAASEPAAADADAAEEDGATAAELVPASDTAEPAAQKAKKKKKKKRNASSASGGAGASSSSLASFPAHTRPLLVHLALPLSLLALCHSGMQAQDATEAQYLSALGVHESLMSESAALLSRQYGAGDETVVFSWLQLLNTWMQYAAAGIEYRSVEQMKAVLHDVALQAHCQHFGAKPDHFKHVWMGVLNNMGLAELLE